MKKKLVSPRYNISDLFLDYYYYEDWFASPLEGDEKVPTMPPPEGEEEEKSKEEKGLKILTPNKLLTTLSILLAQIIAGNYSNKLKDKTR